MTLPQGFDSRGVFRYVCLTCGHRSSDFDMAHEKDSVRNGNVHFSRCSKEACGAPHGVFHVGNAWVVTTAHQAIVWYHQRQLWLKQHLR